MSNIEKINKLYEKLDEIEAYIRILRKMNFDMQCNAPKDGFKQAGEDIARLEMVLFNLTHDVEYCNLIKELNEDRNDLTDIHKRLIDLLYDNYKREKNINDDLAYRKSLVSGEAFSKWLEAKEKSDFSIFKESLSKQIALTREIIETQDEKPSTYYNACLDVLEKGMNQDKLDAFFNALKIRIVPLIKRIVNDGKSIRDDFLNRICPINKQEEMSHVLLKMQGLKQSALVLRTSEHPFTDNFGPNDVRVTTHYFEDMFVSNIFSTLHEGGHALFMQNEPKVFHENHIANSMTNAMHETISRFFENLIGRSKAFIHYFYPSFKEIGGENFKDVSEQDLYEAVNIVKPSLIRIEADELTYSLHILIRYEIEKAFINGEISVDDIPSLWNLKYKEYLGVDVPNDSLGCLQDVHWTDAYGYFPSYALGNAYGAQILNTMNKEFNVEEAVLNGELHKVSKWLIENVFTCASDRNPDEWILKITNEELNPNYFLDYLEEKYTTLYDLK